MHGLSGAATGALRRSRIRQNAGTFHPHSGECGYGRRNCKEESSVDRGEDMALTPTEREKLEDYQQMMGPQAGNLALALDSLTDVMALIGQHTVYCRVEKGPRAGEPPLDIAEVLDTLQKAKSLVQKTLIALRGYRESPGYNRR